MVEDLFQRAVAAFKAGNKDDARGLFMDVVEQDGQHEQAWLYLSALVESMEEQQICLENVLTLDPENQFAEEELDRVRSRLAQLFAPTYVPGEENPPPPMAALLDVAKIPVTTDFPYHDEFDDEWLCRQSRFRPKIPVYPLVLPLKPPLLLHLWSSSSIERQSYR